MRRIVFTVLILLALAGMSAPAQASHGGFHQAIASGPPPFTSSTTATFTLKTFPGAAFLTCKLDARPAKVCFSGTTKTYTGLTAGPHRLVVVGTYDDPVCDPSVPPCPFPTGVSDQWDWTIDTKKPTATLTAPTAPFQLSSTAVANWTGSDGGGSGVNQFKLKSKFASYMGTFGGDVVSTYGAGVTSVQQPMAPGQTGCFSVRAIDKAGNQSAFTPWRCTAVPLDDAPLAASSGWTRITSDSSYFNNTVTKTTAANAKLTSPNAAQVARVGVVATVCPGCGVVQVRVGTTVIGTISLVAPEKKYQRIRSLPAFPLLDGPVKIVTTTSGKQVHIDGLALSRK